MQIVRRSLENGKELTPEEQEAAKRRIQAASNHAYVHDPDSPLLTEKQLSEFRPVNFTNMDERAQAMQNQEKSVDVKTTTPL